MLLPDNDLADFWRVLTFVRLEAVLDLDLAGICLVLLSLGLTGLCNDDAVVISNFLDEFVDSTPGP